MCNVDNKFWVFSIIQGKNHTLDCKRDRRRNFTWYEKRGFPAEVNSLPLVFYSGRDCGNHSSESSSHPVYVYDIEHVLCMGPAGLRTDPEKTIQWLTYRMLTSSGFLAMANFQYSIQNYAVPADITLTTFTYVASQSPFRKFSEWSINTGHVYSEYRCV
jgi:hypothetical protein